MRAVLAGRTDSVGARLLTEQEYLLPLPEEDFESGRSQLPAGGSGRMRQSANELLLGAAEAGYGGGGSRLLECC